ncbi:Ubiquinone/menaquinone biosynthesis C-methyltransferase UbiE [Candidatus Methanoperedenaceae archaeon GB37]|nr:Ubiquinone/menaquinone biosynthesis C-methyltransferase UbiE [Candidatus Methanoperedenaceae archaeon GB37]
MDDMNKIYCETKRYYNKYSDYYDKERTRGYYEFINDLEIDIVNTYIKNDNKILEVGCGTGIILNRISRVVHSKNIIGIDLSEKMLYEAKKKNLNVIMCNANMLPFKNNSFDIVYSFKVIPHIPEIESVIRDIDRITKKDGLMILEFYNPISFKFLANKISCFFEGWKVYCRYDSLHKIKSYLPNNTKIIHIRGIRIFTFISILAKIPIISHIFRFLEENFCDNLILRNFGGYFVVVIKKC